MHRLFGKSKETAAPKAAAPSLEEASAKIDLKVQDLDKKIEAQQAEIKAELAKNTATNPAAKARAMNAMKKKKMYEQQREQMLAQQANLEMLALQQEQAEIQRITVEAMKQGNADLQRATAGMTADDVHDIRDSMEDTLAEMKEVSDALANPMGGVMDAGEDEDLLAEFERMQEEQTMEQLSGLGLSDPMPISQPSGYAQPSAPQPVKAKTEEELEYERMLAEMSGPTAA
jgi:charged multivesicular body protein 4|mmetsp:Transcript_56077/g.88875  ORF Transcript_56077/g.88875 Transcript_56077/m.88875 type:complete len:230 (+) Transcript_56077:79-768(+)